MVGKEFDEYFEKMLFFEMRFSKKLEFLNVISFYEVIIVKMLFMMSWGNWLRIWIYCYLV